MKKVLVISYFFGPANKIGAVRWTKISKYLQNENYDVKVITSVNKNLLFLEDEYLIDPLLNTDCSNLDILEIQHSVFYKKLSMYLRKIFSSKMKDNGNLSKKNNEKKTIKKRILHYGVFFLSLLQDYDFYIQVKRNIKKKEICVPKNTVLITTYGPLSNHIIGLKLRKIFKMWIADFRDPICQYDNYRIEKKINRFFERQITTKCDHLIAVTEGYLSSIINENPIKKCSVITNGFDPLDFEEFEINRNNRDEISFVYTGTLYSGKRDLDHLFCSIRKMIDENKISINKIKFNYAGSQFNTLESMAKLYNLESIIKNYGLVDRRESLEIQSKSDILIVATWNNPQELGVIPGKFLEYLGFKKPILGIVCGEDTGSELKKRINSTNSGYCYETESGDIEGMINFILKVYNNNFKEDEINNKIYSYPYLTKRVIDVMKGDVVLEKNNKQNF